MNRRLCAALVSLVVALMSTAAILAQRAGGAPAVPPLVRENVTEKISDHVFVIPDNSVSMVPNIGIIVGSRATLVVDTGLGARNGQTVVRDAEGQQNSPALPGDDTLSPRTRSRRGRFSGERPDDPIPGSAERDR